MAAVASLESAAAAPSTAHGCWAAEVNVSSRSTKIRLRPPLLNASHLSMAKMDYVPQGRSAIGVTPMDRVLCIFTLATPHAPSCAWSSRRVNSTHLRMTNRGNSEAPPCQTKPFFRLPKHLTRTMQALSASLCGATVALLVASAGAATCPTNPTGNPPPPAPATNCAAFCSGKCPWHSGAFGQNPTNGNQNLTVYRLTGNELLPLGASNKDTGDAAGDLGFYLGRYPRLVRCRPPYETYGCFLADDPVVQEFVIETDGGYGPYLKCNPQPGPHRLQPDPTKPFNCEYGNSTCWCWCWCCWCWCGCCCSC